jgi:DNA-binding Lrp family transcriptional regulator
MVTALVLVNVEHASITETAEQLADIEGIAEVYSVSGDFDIIAVSRVKEYEEIATLVTERLREIPGITKTRTLMAFRTYSKHDLEHIFDIGAAE